jgi:hypothetical protein
VDINIKAIGIATEKSKKTALEAQGAKVFPDINSALSDLEKMLHNPLSSSSTQ